MNIGFDAKRAFNNYTGLGNYSRFIINALKTYYPDNEYYLYSPSVKRNKETGPIIEGNHVITPTTTYRNLGLSSTWRSLFLFNAAAKQPLEIFHGLSNELPFFGGKAVKKVVTIHDLIFIRYPHLFSTIDRKIYEIKFRKACKRADRVVAVSEQTKSDIIDFFNIAEERIEVIYQGCHPNFKPDIPKERMRSVKEKYHLPDSFLLNVGTIEERKNVLHILKAMARHNLDIPLVVIGKATAYKKVLDEYILKHNLEGKVLFLHNVDFSDLPMIYRLSQVFIYPSVFEGFGIPIIEALACHTPVISSTGSCFYEAGGNAAIYVDPNDHEELGQAVKSLLNSSVKRAELLQNIPEHLDKFSGRVIANNIQRLYQSIL